MAQSTGGALYFEGGIDTQKLFDEIAKINAQIKGMADNTAQQGAKMDDVMRNIGAALGGYFSISALAGFGQQIIAVRGEFQQLGIAFETMLGSKEKADNMMAQAVELSQKTPYTLTDVASNIKQLMAMGVGAEDVIGTMRSLGDVAAGVSVPLERVAVNYGQVLTKGKLGGEEMRDFAMSGIPLVAELANNLGRSKSEIQEMVTAGTIGFKDVEKAFQTMSGEGGKFNNLMAKQMTSVTGQISNLKDKLDLMFNSIGQANDGLLSSGIGGVSFMLDHYKAIGSVIEGLILIYGAYKVAVMYANYENKIAVATNALVAESNGFLMASEAREIVMKERSIAAQKALNASMLANPYVLAATAIAALGYGLYKLVTYQTDLEKSLSKTATEFENEKDKASELFAELKRAEIGTQAYEKAKKAVIDQYGSYIPAQFQELKNLQDIKGAQDAVNLSISENVAVKNKKESIDAINAKFNADIIEEQKRIVDKVRSKLGADKAYEINFKISDFITRSKDGSTTEDEAKKLKTDLMSMVGTVDEMGKGTSMAAMNMGAFFNRITSALGDQKKEIGEVDAAYSRFISTTRPKTEDTTTETPKLVTAAQQRIDLEKKLIEEKKKLLDLENKPGLNPLADIEAQKKVIEGIEKQLDIKKQKSDKKNYDTQLQKEKQDRERATVDLEMSITKSKIDAMDDGLEKVLAQNKNNYEKEIEQIKRQKEDALAKLQDQEKTIWESKGGKGKFTPTITSLSPEENAKYDTAAEQARQGKLDADQKAAEASLRQYQTYGEKRIEIIKKYNKDTQDVLAAGGTIENVQEVEKQMNDALATLDSGQNKQNSIITRMFADMSNKSVAEINKLVDQTKEFINFLTNPTGYDAAQGSFFKITEAEYKKLTADPEKMKAYIDQLEKLKETAAKVTPAIARLGEDWKQLSAAFKNGQNEPGDFATQLSSMQTTLGQVTAGVDLLSGAFTALGEATGSDTLKNVGSTLKEIGDVANKTMSGAMTGAAVGGPVGAIVGASLGLITSVAGIFSKAREEREKLKNQVKKDQETAFFGELQLNEEYRKRYEWAKKIGEATLNYIKREGEELKSQTNANAADQKTLWDKLMSSQYKASESFQKTGLFGLGKGKLVEEWATLAGKTYSDIEKLAAQGKLSAEGQKYYEALQKAKAEGQDLEKQQIEYLESLRETYTGSTYDSIVGSIIDGFKDGKRTAEDFAATFEELMNKAVVQSMKLMSEDGIRKWYESFAALSSDGDGLTAEDKAKLKQTWNDLVNNLSGQAKSLEDITGTSLTASASEGSGSTTPKAGLTGEITKTITEATGGELAGLLRKMSDDGRLNRDYTKQAVNHLVLIEANTLRTANNTDRLEAMEASLASIDMNTKQSLSSRDLGG